MTFCNSPVCLDIVIIDVRFFLLMSTRATTKIGGSTPRQTASYLVETPAQI